MVLEADLHDTRGISPLGSEAAPRAWCGTPHQLPTRGLPGLARGSDTLRPMKHFALITCVTAIALAAPAAAATTAAATTDAAVPG